MNAYRLIKPLQPGDKIIALKNRWGFVEEGDLGTLLHQHHTMIGGQMVPAGWVIRVKWRWSFPRLIALILDIVLFPLLWKNVNSFHLFENEFEMREVI
jgi:hypothetical protein